MCIVYMYHINAAFQGGSAPPAPVVPTPVSKVKSESTTRLPCLRILLLLEGVACPFGNLQSLELQSGLCSGIHNRLTTHSKPSLQYDVFSKQEYQEVQ